MESDARWRDPRFFVTEDAREREAALERRLANWLRQLKLATTPDVMPLFATT